MTAAALQEQSCSYARKLEQKEQSCRCKVLVPAQHRLSLNCRKAVKEHVGSHMSCKTDEGLVDFFESNAQGAPHSSTLVSAANGRALA